MGLLIFNLFMAILNMVSFFINQQNILGYINFIIGCLCFFFAGMQVQNVHKTIQTHTSSDIMH